MPLEDRTSDDVAGVGGVRCPAFIRWPVCEARPVISGSLIPSWTETFADLQSASTVEELWAVLLEWHGIRGSSAWEEPYMLFMRFHRHDSTNADMTAAPLCTDHRWRNTAHHLIARLADSGVLDSEQLDELADWFSGEAFEISLETSGGGHRDRVVDRASSDLATTAALGRRT